MPARKPPSSPERFGAFPGGLGAGQPDVCQQALARLVEQREIFHDEMLSLMRQIMSGELTQVQIAGIITGLRVKKETIGEIAAAAQVMREFAAKVPAQNNANLVDTCGTGGDGASTYNISTAAAFVAAGAGAIVAKHGNRAQSSKSGSADVLEALGIRLNLAPDAIAQCIAQTGIGFMFAPAHHGALKVVAPIRRELGFRTLFNLTGPLANPAHAKFQLMGVFDERWLDPLARTLSGLGAQRAWIVHGQDGLDEITTTTLTDVATLENGRTGRFVISPTALGFPAATLEDLKGGDAAHNAAALRGVLDGAHGPYRDIVVLNAAATLVICGRANHLGEGVEAAAHAIDSGAAKGKLDALSALTQSLGPKA